MILQCPPSMSNISKRILSTSSSKDFATFDSIGFWKQRKNQFPVLYRMCYSPNWDVDTRWNSTFEMFESGLKQKTTLRFKKFPVEYWVMIEMLNLLLEVFQNATVILSGVLPLDVEECVFNVEGNKMKPLNLPIKKLR
ncbi:hypothetical protein Tco_1036664 [Tanacetum coccineum]